MIDTVSEVVRYLELHPITYCSTLLCMAVLCYIFKGIIIGIIMGIVFMMWLNSLRDSKLTIRYQYNNMRSFVSSLFKDIREPSKKRKR